MPYYLKFNKKLTLLLIIFSFLFLGCSNLFKKNLNDNDKTISVLKTNQSRFNKYIHSKTSRYYFANQIIESIPGYENLDEYEVFKINSAIKLMNFHENLKVLKEVKNRNNRINGYIQAAYKYIHLKRYDKSFYMLKKAENELSEFVEKTKSLNQESALLYNRILQISCTLNEFEYFEHVADKLILKSQKYNLHIEGLDYIRVPLKKYIIKSFKVNKTYSNKILEYLEYISWNVVRSRPYTDKPLSEIKLVEPLLSNPEKDKAVALIQLAELYGEIDNKEKIKHIYNEIQKIWQNSIENPNLGKSFGTFIPKFIKILYSSGFKEEAIFFLNQVPDIYPYSYKNGYNSLSKSYLAYHKHRIKKYNKKAYFHKLKAYKNIIKIKIDNNEDNSLFKWVIINVKNEKMKKEALGFILDKTDINGHDIVKYLLKSNDIFKNNINFKDLCNTYIPILKFYYKNDTKKADKFLDLLISSINKKNIKEKNKFLIKLAKELKFNQKQCIVLCENTLKNIYNSKSSPDYKVNKIHSIMTLYKDINPKDRKNYFASELFFKKAEKIIDEVPYSRNFDRHLSEKIGCSLAIANSLIALKEYNKSIYFIAKAENYTNKIRNSELKNRYLKMILFKYARIHHFKKAFDIFKGIDLGKTDKNSFIKEINKYFNDYMASKSTWLLMDHDLDGLPSFCNPEASGNILLKKCSKLDTDSDNDGICDAKDPEPYLIN